MSHQQKIGNVRNLYENLQSIQIPPIRNFQKFEYNFPGNSGIPVPFVPINFGKFWKIESKGKNPEQEATNVMLKVKKSQNLLKTRY